MKKLAVWSVLLLATLAMALAGNQGITVGSPYLVTEWCIGTNLSIQWSLWGDWEALGRDAGNQQVRIMLVSVGGHARPRVIAAAAPAHIPGNNAVGSYQWPIPSDVLPGEYHVRVMTVNKLHKGESEVFTIKSCQKTLAVREPRLMTRTVEHAALSIGRIAGRVSASTQGNLIAGRKVRVLLKKSGATVASAEYTLDAQGGADYQFTRLLLGTYEVSVEKVASPPPADPGSMLNVCFNGTTPALRTAVIASGGTDVSGQDFAILYDVAFNMSGVCW